MTEIYDITIRAGNSGTVASDLGLVVNLLVGPEGAEDPFDMTGQEIVFRVLQGGTQVLRKTSGGDIVIAEGLDRAGVASGVNNLVTVPFTVADSRTLEAAGAGLTYDLERRDGSNQRALVAGAVFVEPGANDD